MAIDEGEVGSGLLANLTPRQRIFAIGSLATIVILFISLIFLLATQKGEDKYIVVVKDLPRKSVAEAVEHLKEERIEYEVRDEGRAIAVIKEKKDQALLALAAEGLPRDGKVGFEIFGDKASGMLSTDFEKKVALQRAMNGELSRVIKQMEQVDDANVFIVVPEPQLFQEQQLPTTASVLVKLSGRGGFGKSEIDSVKHLVASAVPGLKPNNVTIVDTDGNMLAAGQGTAETETSKMSKELEQKLSIRREMESKKEAKLVELLEKIVGPGNAKVRVSLDVNFDSIQRRKKDMLPVMDQDGNPIPIARKVLRERSEEPKSLEGGVAGSSGNITDEPAEGDNISSSAMSTRAKDTDQETLNFNQVEELITPAMGDIERMTIAITYQYNQIPGLEEGAEGGPTRLSVEEIEDVVKQAIGFDNTRGDKITVKEVTFDDSMQQFLKEQMERQAAAAKKVPWWVALIAGLVALVIGAGIGGALLGKKAPPPDAGAFGAPGAAPGADYAAVPSPGGPPGGAIPPPDQGGQAPGGAPGAGPEVAAPQDKVEVARAAVAPPPDNPFGFLYGVEAETVANLLSSERLPTLVAVLAQLDPAQADEVIKLLSPEIQSEVRNRLASNPVLPPMTQKMVSQSLKKRLQTITSMPA